MGYQSLIEVIQTQMRNQIEGEIYKAVMNVGVNVDKEELLKALQYDRGQYQKGYKDRDDQIVRCEDCTWWGPDRMCENSDSPCFQNGCTHGNWFCADGERKEGR